MVQNIVDIMFSFIAQLVSIMPSIQSRLLAQLFRLSGQKKRTRKRAHNPRRKPSGFVPKWIGKTTRFDQNYIDERMVVTLHPQKTSGNTHIIFLHGGGYVLEITSGHWWLITKLIKELNCRITIPQYPLAPESDYQNTHRWLGNTYQSLCHRYPEDQFILIGDSAGGGLALSFAQSLVENRISHQVQKIVLLSPWLDLSQGLSAGSTDKIDDYLLSPDFLDYCASLYSKGGDLNSYLLSPINGRFVKLPPVAVFFGSNELFHPECLHLQKLSQQVKANFQFFEYRGMQHDWLLFPLPETKRAIRQIKTFLAGNPERL